jgi:uncharacterized membrane protein YedE/YeeE
MIFPIDALSDERRALGLVLAVPIGIAFGFVLERSGFGRAQKLVGQFYGTDMTVLKVMFTAIATAAVGMALLAAVGVFDLSSAQFNYPTWMAPMAVGGLLLGVGFVTSGYCPGTSLVACASGKLDGLATVLGVIAGTLAYAELEPSMGGFQNATKRGTFTLPQLLHLPPLVVALLVVALAVAAFALATRIQARVTRPAAPPSTSQGA